MQFAASTFEIKALDEGGSIEGMLADFSSVDLGGDQLLPGCLTKSLAKRTTPLPMLLGHALDKPIGAWKSWEDRSSGLYVKGKMTLAARDGREAYELARDGALTGLSIGWAPKETARGDLGERLVVEAEIFEGSLVPVPMNDRCRVVAVKEFAEARDIADILQAAGMSGRKARLVAGVGWKAINGMTDEDGPDEDELDPAIVAMFEAHIARLAAQGGRQS